MPPPAPLVATSTQIALTFIELGVAIVGLSLLARFASRWGFSTIPLFLLAGLAFGNGGFFPLNFSEDFIHLGSEIGIVLMLFMLGLEYTGEQLADSLKTSLPAGLVDFILNFTPGLIAGFLLGWGALAAMLLGGVTYVSSSGVIARLLSELKWQNNPETPTILGILVIEDLAMAVFLPLAAVLLIGQSLTQGIASILIAITTVAVVLFVALKFGTQISDRISHESDEIVMLTTFGIVLLVAGLAQMLQVSAAVGAFLVGIALSGPLAHQAHRVLAPLRDLFAAVFFFFFGLQIDPGGLPPVILIALILGTVTVATKILTGWWAAGRAGLDAAARLRAGAALAARGEFSIVIAGLAVGAELTPQLGPVSAAYVLFLAILGPILARFVTTTAKDQP